MPSRSRETWEKEYETAIEALPWFSPRLDSDFGSFLPALGGGQTLWDLGSGPGTQAIALVKRGFRVTGTDITDAAIRNATERAKAAGVDVVFRQDDVLESALDGAFDFIVDRGCFHVIDVPQRRRFAEQVAKRLAPNGRFLLKCFSTEQPGDRGPHRLDRAQLDEAFADRLELLQEGHGTFDVEAPHVPPKAIFTVWKLRS